MSLRLAMLLSGGGLCFRATVEAQSRGLISPTFLLAMCDRESSAITFAQTNKIEHALIPFQQFNQRADFDNAINVQLKEHRINAAILNYDRLISASTLALLEHRCINLHLSLLPLFSGLGALPKTLASGMKLSGITFHWVDESIDGGAILAQRSVPLYRSDDIQILTKRLYRQAVPLHLQIVRLLERNVLATGECPDIDSIDSDIAKFSEDYLSILFA